MGPTHELARQPSCWVRAFYSLGKHSVCVFIILYVHGAIFLYDFFLSFLSPISFLAVRHQGTGRYSTQIRSRGSVPVKSWKSPEICIQKSLIVLFSAYQWQNTARFLCSYIVWFYMWNTLEPWFKKKKEQKLLISVACLVSICWWHSHLALWGGFVLSMIWAFFPFDFLKFSIFSGWAYKSRCNPSL